MDCTWIHFILAKKIRFHATISHGILTVSADCDARHFVQSTNSPSRCDYGRTPFLVVTDDRLPIVDCVNRLIDLTQ